MKLYQHKTLGGILLIAGTAIGAGMLALPIITGVAGIVGSLLLLGVCYLFMLATLFLLLEANSYSTELEANVISMANARLGAVGQIVAWLTFLLLLYAAAAAYISGCGSLFAKLIQSIVGKAVPATSGILLCVFLFGILVWFGTSVIDYVNRVLMGGLIIVYIALVIFVSPHIEWQHFGAGKPRYLLAAVPVVVLSFTSNIIVPSLRTYLKNDTKQLKKVLLLGSLIPLVLYAFWEILIIGVIPESGLEIIGAAHHPVAALTNVLQFDLNKPKVALMVGSFSFFALVTSFLGVALSLTDFLADGLHIRKTILGRSLLLLLSFIPPLLFALFYPQGFIVALSFAGVFVAILYGVLPVIMVYKARYVEGLSAEFRLFGGKAMLVLIFVGAVLITVFQIAATCHWIPTLK